jgi:lipopolysaccharide export system protein LptA
LRFTIERIRTLVLAAGVLLVVALGAFLAIGKFKGPFSRKDIPKRLGIDIQQEANGVTYTQARGGHTLFKIHASKVVQLKNDHALLHDVMIELYGTDGSRVDRIAGSDFEYDQKEGKATAAGPVEITLMRPGVAPAIAPKSVQEKAAQDRGAEGKAGQDRSGRAAADGQIHVKTSAVTFDQQTGEVTTAAHVDFSMAQGSGSSTGAMYDSDQGFLVLDKAVELTTRRGAAPVEIHAEHADFERDLNLCNLRAAMVDYRGDHATAADAKVVFRTDGSAVRLDASGGFTLTTAAGSRVAAPLGSMDFDEHNQPRDGHMEGGVAMESVSDGRTVQGSSPVVDLVFAAGGELRHAHLEQGVEMHSEETRSATVNGKPGQVRLTRTWRSPVADVEFRDAGQGHVEPASLRGAGGVVVTGLSQRGGEAPSPSRLAADDVTGTFGPNDALTAMTGVGHASMEQTTATGTHETASGDRLEARFAQGEGAAAGNAKSAQAGAAQVQAATLDGQVVLVEQPAAKPGGQAQPEMRATAGHAEYEGDGERLHLTQGPRVVDGGLQMTGEKIDVTEETGDAMAHGDIKATWTNAESGQAGGTSGAGNGAGIATLGGQGPAHIVADEAELHQATGEATFRGNARLWQQANAVTAPVIVLDRQRQTLAAQATDAGHPVKVVMVSTNEKPEDAGKKQGGPSVIRMQGGNLLYSDGTRRAVMHGGIIGTVTADTGSATSVSDLAELQLAPAGAASGQAQVERMTATGHVVVSSEGRRGTGEQLVYTGADGSYVLTGTHATPPKMTDPERGSVTGAALIFHSRDDSVSIEGGADETVTQTTAPK